MRGRCILYTRTLLCIISWITIYQANGNHSVQIPWWKLSLDVAYKLMIRTLWHYAAIPCPDESLEILESVVPCLARMAVPGRVSSPTAIWAVYSTILPSLKLWPHITNIFQLPVSKQTPPAFLPTLPTCIHLCWMTRFYTGGPVVKKEAQPRPNVRSPASRACFCTWYAGIWPLPWGFYLLWQAFGIKEVSWVGIETKSLSLLSGPPEYHRRSLLLVLHLHLRNTASSLTRFYSYQGPSSHWAKANRIPSSDKGLFLGPCWSLALFRSSVFRLRLHAGAATNETFTLFVNRVRRARRMRAPQIPQTDCRNRESLGPAMSSRRSSECIQLNRPHYQPKTGALPSLPRPVGFTAKGRIG